MECACPSACRSGYALLPFKKKIFCTAFPIEPSARIVKTEMPACPGRAE